MSEDLLRYDLMIEAALRDVVRETLENVARNGLPGDHHFYITFQTKFPGVMVPDYLREQYPDEMTIVLQYQFFGMRVENDTLFVTLSFNNIKESLAVPIESITTFADPSVNFALQFQGSLTDSDEDEEDEDGDGEEAEEGESTEPAEGKTANKSGEPGEKPAKTGKKANKEAEEKRGEVISLDKFRKK